MILLIKEDLCSRKIRIKFFAMTFYLFCRYLKEKINIFFERKH
jgi:hypothetical protein